MRKEIYLIRGIEKEDYTTFSQRLLNLAVRTAGSVNPAALKVVLTQQCPPKISIIPYKKSKIAVVSVYKESPEPVDSLKQEPGFSGAFKVEEALPVAYERTWLNGEITPGICLLTLFHRKPGIDYDLFLDRWHKGHTPLSLKLHPLWHYNRNVVLQTISDHPAWYDGIVEEHTRTKSELMNPFKFFGSLPDTIPNMFSVYRDTNGFLDYKKIETYLTAEYHIV
jgi:hypothetical protein